MIESLSKPRSDEPTSTDSVVEQLDPVNSTSTHATDSPVFSPWNAGLTVSDTVEPGERRLLWQGLATSWVLHLAIAVPLFVYGANMAANQDLTRVATPSNPPPVPVSFSLQLQSPKPVMEVEAQSTTQVAEAGPVTPADPVAKPEIQPKKVAKKRRSSRKKHKKPRVQLAAATPTPIAPPAEKGEGPTVAPVAEQVNLPSGPSVAQAVREAPKKVASGTGLGRKSAVDLDGMLKSYIKALSRAVRRDYTYPRAAQRAGLEGRAVVRIVLDSTGAIIEVALATSSGHPILDKAALHAASSVKHLPAAPSSLDWGRRAIKVPFNFRATG